jgi:hypothetical protein
VLALLLDAGAPINARPIGGFTALMTAVGLNHLGCVVLLIDRGGEALDLDAKEDDGGRPALHLAAEHDYSDIVQLLLQAGADPTIFGIDGLTALDVARSYNHHACIPLLEAALAEPQRSRLLFKTRALLDAAHATHKARSDAQAKGHPAAVQQQEAMAAAPVYLKQRVAQAQALPRVSIHHHHNNNNDEEEEQRTACLKYALGVEGGGGVVLEGQDPAVGMLPEVLVELLEMMVPKWDPAQKGRPLGEGYIEVQGHDDDEVLMSYDWDEEEEE